MAGKGSNQRPLAISQQQFGENWNDIFSKKKNKPKYTKLESTEQPTIDKNIVVVLDPSDTAIVPQ